MIIERRLIPPAIEIVVNDNNELSFIMKQKQATNALLSSLHVVFLQEGRKCVERGIEFQEASEILVDVLYSSFFVGMLQGRYVRDPDTGIWDVTLN